MARATSSRRDEPGRRRCVGGDAIADREAGRHGTQGAPAVYTWPTLWGSNRSPVIPIVEVVGSLFLILFVLGVAVFVFVTLIRDQRQLRAAKARAEARRTKLKLTVRSAPAPAKARPAAKPKNKKRRRRGTPHPAMRRQVRLGIALGKRFSR
jgi:hypothetical protein